MWRVRNRTCGWWGRSRGFWVSVWPYWVWSAHYELITPEVQVYTWIWKLAIPHLNDWHFVSLMGKGDLKCMYGPNLTEKYNLTSTFRSLGQKFFLFYWFRLSNRKMVWVQCCTLTRMAFTNSQSSHSCANISSTCFANLENLKCESCLSFHPRHGITKHANL